MPYNVGKPVNTTQDDKFYVVSSDGERGYYSSERKDGLGQQDIYMVEPGLFGKPSALVLITGNITYDNEPIKATIFVQNEQTAISASFEPSLAKPTRRLINITSPSPPQSTSLSHNK